MIDNKTRNVCILLKDGTFLKCVIFENDSIHQNCIIDEEIINQKLRFNENRTNKDLVYFQTKYINGKLHPSNVLWYEIGWVSDDYLE